MAPAEVVRLYRAVLRAAGSFSDYNFRHYFQRRAREDFRAFEAGWRRGAVDAAGREEFMLAGNKQLGMLKRQGILSQLYESGAPTGKR
mmetsp:Transcript_75199/g.212684  ORF Transcript_75199/g.212684 Transcript_75199/m.212684 type:complete len:88 (+) Transcript_75199:75-338(+)